MIKFGAFVIFLTFVCVVSQPKNKAKCPPIRPNEYDQVGNVGGNKGCTSVRIRGSLPYCKVDRDCETYGYDFKCCYDACLEHITDRVCKPAYYENLVHGGGGYNSGSGTGHSSGFGTGQNSGFGTGHSSGFGTGHSSGFGTGHNSGFGTGHSSGFGTGHNSGFSSGHSSNTDIHATIHTQTDIHANVDHFSQSQGGFSSSGHHGVPEHRPNRYNRPNRNRPNRNRPNRNRPNRYRPNRNSQY